MKFIKLIYFLFLLLYNSNIYAQEGLNALIKKSEQMAEDSNQVKAFLEIAEYYLDSNRPNALKYSFRALEISEKLNYKKGISKSNYLLGKIYFLDENYEFSKKYFNDAYLYAESQGMKDDMAKNLGNLGMIYYRQSNYIQALDYTLKSLKIIEESDNKKNAVTAYNMLGNIYGYLDNGFESLKYYYKALTLAEEIKDTQFIAIVLNNIGGNYYKDKNYEKALEFYLKSLPLKIHLKQEKSIAFAYNNIGMCYLMTGDKAIAYDYLMKGLRIREKLKNKQGILYSCSSLGNYYYEIGDYDMALYYLSRAESIGIELHSFEDLKNIYNLQSQIFEKKGNYAKALAAHKQFKIMSDSLYNESNTKKITQLSMQFEFDKQKQKAEIEHLKEQEKMALQVKNQKILNLLIILVLLLVWIPLIVLWKSFRQKKRDNLLLAQKHLQILEQTNAIVEKNEELIQQKEEIIAQAELLAATNKELYKLSIVASKTDNAIIIADKYGDIEWVNDAFTRLYGYTLDEFIALKGKNLRSGSTNPEIDSVLNQVINFHKPVVYTTLNYTKDGHKVWSQSTLTPILDDNTELQYIVVVDANITLIKLAEREIEKQNKDITDSIRYASRIQSALKPSEKFLKAILPNHFIINIPRDIVSGDFYWVSYKNHKTILAVADCTGHGVPGAFMSVLGIAFLKEIVNYLKTTDAAEILCRMREKVINTLHQRGKEGEAADGIDMALCVFDFSNRTLQYSGANKSIYIVRNSELIEYKPDSYPIGIHEFRNKPFTNHHITLETNDLIYISSDGYVDQFGGDTGKKFLVKRFKKLLTDIHNKPMDEQKSTLEKTFFKWKGSYQQVDDVLVVGIRVT